MTDPSWLPSAIMQTMTAILGFYAVVYALVIEKVITLEFKRLKPQLFFGFNLFFIVFLGCCIYTICLNVFWLDSLSGNVLNLEIPPIGTYTIISFFVTLLVMFAYTVIMMTVAMVMLMAKK